MESHVAAAVTRVDRPSLDRLGEEIAELSAHLEAASARLLDLIRDFDAREGWSGFRSCAHWLHWRVGLDMGAARERVRVARALGTLPRIARALATAEISYAKARAITRVATAQTEERLLKVALAGTASHVERLVRGWRCMDRKAEVREAVRQHSSRALDLYHDDEGMVVVRGRVAPEVGALLLRALDAARQQLYQEAPAKTEASFACEPAQDPPTMAQQRADALALLAETALHCGLDPGTPGERYQVVVHVDAPVLRDEDGAGQSVLEEGPRVSAETSRRLACDASRVVMRHDRRGHLVEVGARTRTIPPALHRALNHRDGGCRFPGCSVRTGDGHHIQHWANGGPTKLSNLVVLCRRHHRAVHEDGYQIVRHENGALEFRRPDGRSLPEVPPSPPVPPDPARTLRAAHDANGLRLDEKTLHQTWTGEPFDVGWAIDVLHPLAAGENVDDGDDEEETGARR